MALKKRGLGRGLESLLADTKSIEEPQQLALDLIQVNAQTGIAKTLSDDLRRENLLLLREAENLRTLLAEFETLIRTTLP